MSAQASIIICTANRAEHLRQTLESLACVHVPTELLTEVIVVDNGSTDGTAELVQGYSLPNMPVRYLHEPRRGQCYARISGMTASKGAIVIFTDDDLRFPVNWIAGMCRPILEGRADAVIGGVRIASHLVRDWQGPQHLAWLAESVAPSPASPADNHNTSNNANVVDLPAMIGANMAFGRHVLEKVPAFDVELGPGALGFYDDTLFSHQLREAGYTLLPAYETAVEHHFDPERLSRAAFKRRALAQGRSEAYVVYHWRHEPVANAERGLRRLRLLLPLRRLRRRGYLSAEGMAAWEMEHLRDIGFHQQYLIEQQRPRAYDRHGLIKRIGQDNKA